MDLTKYQAYIESAEPAELAEELRILRARFKQKPTPPKVDNPSLWFAYGNKLAQMVQDARRIAMILQHRAE